LRSNLLNSKPVNNFRTQTWRRQRRTE